MITQAGFQQSERFTSRARAPLVSMPARLFVVRDPCANQRRKRGKDGSWRSTKSGLYQEFRESSLVPVPRFGPIGMAGMRFAGSIPIASALPTGEKRTRNVLRSRYLSNPAQPPPNNACITLTWALMDGLAWRR